MVIRTRMGSSAASLTSSASTRARGRRQRNRGKIRPGRYFTFALVFVLHSIMDNILPRLKRGISLHRKIDDFA